MPEIEGSTTDISDDIALLEEGEEGGAPEEKETSEIQSGVPNEGAPDKDEPEAEPETEEKPYEVAHPFNRPSIKQINEKYPEIFKTFPSLRDMYFREAEFSKVFPTIDDAREASKDVEIYRGLRSSLEQGKNDDLFKFLDNEKLLEEFAPQIFPSLVRTRPEAFWSAANPFIEDICRNMFNKGVKDGDQNIQNAARHLAEFFFGDLLVAEGKRTFVKQPDPARAAELKASEKYDNERYLTFRSGVAGSIQSEMSRLINEGGKLDGLSPFLQSVIADKIIENVGSTLQSDTNHIKYMDSLWDRAKKSGRTEEDKARLVSAYLARAKSLIPSLRSKFLAEVNGKGPSASAEKIKRVSSVANRTAESGNGRPSGTRSLDYNPRRIDYSKTSDLDILNDEVKYKN